MPEKEQLEFRVNWSRLTHDVTYDNKGVLIDKKWVKHRKAKIFQRRFAATRLYKRLIEESVEGSDGSCWHEEADGLDCDCALCAGRVCPAVGIILSERSVSTWKLLDYSPGEETDRTDSMGRLIEGGSD